MMEWFANEVSHLEWSKPRKLPEWATNIFSTSMIAAGNVQKEEELVQIYELAMRTLDEYIETVSEIRGTPGDYTEQQNYYAINQKQNPHTPRVMASLGLDEEDVRVFIQDCLFPEIR